MKKIRSLKLLVVLLVFSAGLENCTVKTQSYCQKDQQTINCPKNNSYMEESPSNVFPENDLIIKI